MTQASIFALQVALFDLISDFGPSPDYLIGHSIGELSAAHLSGVLSLQDAAKLVAARGTLMAALPQGGAMASIRASEQEARESLKDFEGRLTIAAVNSPSSVSVSGEEEALEEWEALQGKAGKKTKRLDVSHAFHSQLIEPMLAEFEQLASTLEFNAPQIPIVSNVTAEELTDRQATSPAYWASQIREAVCFAKGIQHLEGKGVSRFLELGAGTTLTALAAETLEDEEATFAPSLGKDAPEPTSFIAALGAMHASGAKPDFKALLGEPPQAPAELPTYPFQRQRYWLESTAGSGDASALGQSATDHPLLGASISLATEGTHLFTGRISQKSHPWIGDHVIAGNVLVPGMAFVEMALTAGAEHGARHLEELILEAPLILPEAGATQIQVTLFAEEEDPERLQIAIHSRAEQGQGEADSDTELWTRHVSGVLTSEDSGPAGFEVGAWPPEGAEPIATEDVYDEVAEIGIEYGPAFQGLGAAWRLGEELYAEVSLADEQVSEASRFAVHPALLDAAGHAALAGADPAEGVRLPFGFSGVDFGEAAGASDLRVRISAQGDRLRLDANDREGVGAVSIASLLVRPLDPAQLQATDAKEPDALFDLNWVEVEPGEGAQTVEVEMEMEMEIFESASAQGEDPAQAAHRLSTAALAAIQAFLADEGKAESRLAILTEGAMALSDSESPDPAAAAVWGLVRSAQSEHPGRFLLIDSDGSDASGEALAAALAQVEEPQLALREGVASVPRLAPAEADAEAEFPSLDPEGTVLIIGGLSGLGAITARHLAGSHGVKNLLLTSRRGPKAPGAPELIAELAGLGCQAKAIACDVSDRSQLQALLAAIPAEHSLTAIVHSAGALDDGTIEALEPQRIDTVLAPKADGAWHLHELTQEMDLAAFVLYSSGAAVFGSPGQGNYAAANAFLDALARRRRAMGLPATAIAWGMWEAESGGMTEDLSESDRDRLVRMGAAPISGSYGVELFDRACSQPAPFRAAIPVDKRVLRAAANAGLLPPLLSGLVPASRRRPAASTGSLARHLATLPEAEREVTVLTMVREHTAAVLGHSPEAIDPAANFKDLGFDSLGAVELRNRLARASGMRLEATLVFDYPSTEAIAGYLLERAQGEAGGAVEVRASRFTEEPIAIVGISCRYPGGVGSPQGLWALLASGVDGIVEFPEDRGWDVERLYDPDPERAGKSYVRHGGFLEDAADFDPAFFSISPREALVMDPQQRLLLEGAWEALEDAGVDPASLRGTPTGVFAGVMYADYGGGGSTASSSELETFGGTGIAGSVASGRVSYALGLEGPAVTVDTACSSSLVAMHLAAQALRSGECEMALAGGVTTMASPVIFVGMSRQRGLAPDGRCKSFSAEADGTGWSEGCGLLLLERLSDAKRNNRRILAVIKGSATNQDGASNGLTAPNGPSQERVIRQALANAGLKPSEVDAVEAHGTGTVLGDPIEAQALLATYGQERDNGPLALGSLKSNIGHTQAAAGVGGVIKMVMALREEELPPTLHASEPTPHVDWSTGEIELLNEAREWKRGGRPRRAGVSSFGISGTNAHVIIEEPPELPSPQRDEEARPPAIPWAISAKTPEALRDYAGKLAAHAEKTDQDPIDVAHTLLSSRASLSHRAVVVGSDKEELLQGLDALVKGSSHRGLATAKATQGKTAFLLSGQGSQRAQMGKELYEAFPTYAKAFDRACEALQEHLPFSVKDAVFADEGTELAKTLSRTDVTQASIFALQVALFDLISDFGLSPDYLIGHSIGELSAAHLSGVLSLQDAAKLVAARGTLMAALPKGGAMASIRASEQEVKESLAEFEGLTIAAVNSPSSVSVSGEEEALEEWEALQEEQDKKTKRLDVSHAFHSQLIEPMLEEFEQLASTLEFKAPRIPIVSNVTAEELSEKEATSPAYWASQIREAVRFAKGIESLKDKGVGRYLELGAGTTLTALAAETVEEEEATFAPSLGKDAPEPTSLIAALGAMHASGAKPDFKVLLAEPPQAPAELPTYPFQRRRYWLESMAGSGDASALGQSATDHPLLGASISLATEGTRIFTGRISQKSHPWVKDHVVGGTVILPGTAIAEMALAAGAEVGAEYLEELEVRAQLALPDSGALLLQAVLSIDEEDPERFELTIHSRPELVEDEEELDEGSWRINGVAVLRVGGDSPVGFDATVWPPEGAEPIATEDFYDEVAEIGLEYGPAFQGLEAAWRLGEELYAEVSLAEEQSQEAERFGVHPALLDAAGQALRLDSTPAEGMRMPTGFLGISLGEVRGSSQLLVRIVPGEAGIRLDAADESGNAIVSIDAIVLGQVDSADLQVAAREPDALFRLDWREVDMTSLTELEEPSLDVFECASTENGDLAAAAHLRTAEALSAIQTFLSDESRVGDRMAIVVKGAVAVSDGEPADPVAASVWGLARSAQSEHPGRFVLVDCDESEASRGVLSAAFAQGTEPQLALRDGAAFAPRLKPFGGQVEEPSVAPGGRGTTLITGGLSGLGAIAARHFARSHGTKRILLAGRRGPDTPGAAELIADLAELGCEASAVACDVSDRDQVEELLARVPDDQPLTAVVHAAGILDDSLTADLNAERIGRVLAPKAGGAWHLHELTAGMDLDMFVLYSSAAAVLGGPGQGNYAAANSFLDALACRRRAEGLPATSIAWGMWEAESAMTGGLGDADRKRLARFGIAPIATEQGLQLLDRARFQAEPMLLAMAIDRAALRPLVSAGLLPPMISGLMPARRRRRATASAAQRRKLVALPEAERTEAVLGLVRAQVAAVLGYASSEAVEPDATLLELGLDSLGALELRNRLAVATGIELEPTAAFEYPSPAALARLLGERLSSGGTEGSSPDASPGSSTLATLLVHSHAEGRSAGVLPLLAEASKFRPSFRDAAELGSHVSAAAIGNSGPGARLVCVPSFIVGSGPHQFVRIARALSDCRPLTALALPGSRRGDALPASWGAAMEVLTDATLRAAGDAPFVVAGYSSGGAIARGLVERLEAMQRAPLGLVLIDAYIPLGEGIGKLFAADIGRLLEMGNEAIAVDDDHLLAMGGYMRTISEWEPGSIAVPDLMVRATAGERAALIEGEELPAWQRTTDTVDVPGDHFEVIGETAEQTAEAIDAWAARLEPEH